MLTLLIFSLHLLFLSAPPAIHAIFLKNFAVTIFIPTDLPWIHLPHCTHTTEVAFILKLQASHRSTFLSDKPSFVVSPLIITLVLKLLQNLSYALVSNWIDT